MARKGLPKKFAKMGFKRGWKAYKSSTRAKPVARRKVVMARRRSYTRARKYARRRASKPALKGLIKKVGIGVGVGVANKVIPPIYGINGIPTTALGWLLNDQTVMTIGGLQIGQSLADKFVGGNGGNGGYV